MDITITHKDGVQGGEKEPAKIYKDDVLVDTNGEWEVLTITGLEE